mmetsp:Transcript_33276/g.61314  ORF Transcript_33276/g.61314 Transcript_33276/m.61314 type:complete len:84 (-) Transcript_33276:257-508(-)
MYIDKDIKFVRFWVGKLIGMPRSPSILVFHLPSVSTTTRIHLRSPDDINHGPPSSAIGPLAASVKTTRSCTGPLGYRTNNAPQ